MSKLNKYKIVIPCTRIILQKGTYEMELFGEDENGIREQLNNVKEDEVLPYVENFETKDITYSEALFCLADIELEEVHDDLRHQDKDE